LPEPALHVNETGAILDINVLGMRKLGYTNKRSIVGCLIDDLIPRNKSSTNFRKCFMEYLEYHQNETSVQSVELVCLSSGTLKEMLVEITECLETGSGSKLFVLSFKEEIFLSDEEEEISYSHPTQKSKFSFGKLRKSQRGSEDHTPSPGSSPVITRANELKELKAEVAFLRAQVQKFEQKSKGKKKNDEVELFESVDGKPQFVHCTVDGWFCAVRQFSTLGTSKGNVAKYSLQLQKLESLDIHRNLGRYLRHKIESNQILVFTSYPQHTVLPFINKQPKTEVHETIFSLIVQLLQGLSHLHSLKLEHGHLQLSDLSLTFPREKNGEPTLQISGYGIHTWPDVMVIKENTSSPPRNYISSIKKQRNKRRLSDIWAVGVILHQLITGFHPFQAMLPSQIEQAPTLPIPESSKSPCLNYIYNQCTSFENFNETLEISTILDRVNKLVSE